MGEDKVEVGRRAWDFQVVKWVRPSRLNKGAFSGEYVGIETSRWKHQSVGPNVSQPPARDAGELVATELLAKNCGQHFVEALQARQQEKRADRNFVRIERIRAELAGKPVGDHGHA